MSTAYETPKPVAPFPYWIRTTQVMEHSRGIAWTAELHTWTGDERVHAVIGTVEQAGDGGADRVYIERADDRARWEAAVREAFPTMDEEAATFHLLVQEEEGNA